MYRGTTPVIILNVKSEIDFSTIAECRIVLENEGGSNEKVYTDVEIDEENKQIRFQMSQEDTYNFYAGTIKLQARIKLTNGSIIPSKIKTTMMYDNLEEVVI